MEPVTINVNSHAAEGVNVNAGELVIVKMKVKNNLPWELTNVRYELTDVTGHANLEPAPGSYPKQVVGDDIGGNDSGIQEFTLRANSEGNATAKMKLMYDVKNTGLTWPVNKNLSFSIAAPN